MVTHYNSLLFKQSLNKYLAGFFSLQNLERALNYGSFFPGIEHQGNSGGFFDRIFGSHGAFGGSFFDNYPDNEGGNGGNGGEEGGSPGNGNGNGAGNGNAVWSLRRNWLYKVILKCSFQLILDFCYEFQTVQVQCLSICLFYKATETLVVLYDYCDVHVFCI